MKETTFLEFLRERPPADTRSNDELVRAILPLLEQLQTLHESGRVAPLDGVGRVFNADGQLWVRALDANPVSTDLTPVQRVGWAKGGGVEVVGSGKIERTGSAASIETDVRRADEPVSRPLYVPGYSTWELELGVHDELTDIFCAGMMLASLATGLDFTERAELVSFIACRRTLTRTMAPALHPVLARAIVRMTELDRHRRVQDLPGLIQRIRHYREVNPQEDAPVDFAEIAGVRTTDRHSRQHVILSHLQTRLFDVSRRNRLIWYKSTRQQVDLTMASVPLRLAVNAIRSDDLFLWEPHIGPQLVSGNAVALDAHVRFEEHPWIGGALNVVRSEDRRSRNEVGFSQLRLVVAFFNWHDLKNAPDERVTSPLLLLPARIAMRRGVRDRYELSCSSGVAEVNPVLRHYLRELYGLDLPEEVDLSQVSLREFHATLEAAVQRSEPSVSVHYVDRPQIRMMREVAKRRTDTWRRRSRATGRGLRSELGVEYSYGTSNYAPLGQQLYRRFVRPPGSSEEEHFQDSRAVASDPANPAEEATEREVYQRVERAAGPYDWSIDLTRCTLGNFNYRKMTLVRDYARLLDVADDEPNPAFESMFREEARRLGSAPTEAEWWESYFVVPADPTQAAAIQWARGGQSFIIQGPPGTGKSQTITNLIADFVARGKRVLFVCQKRAALDVVHHRLAQFGLDELSVLIHDSQEDKAGFLADLGATYKDWATSAPTPWFEERLESTRRQMIDTVATLHRVRDALAQPASGSTEALLQVVSERLLFGETPTLDERSAEGLPSIDVWAAVRAAVRELGGLLGVGPTHSMTAQPVLCLSSEIINAERPASELSERLATFDRHRPQLRSAAAALGEGRTLAELDEAIALWDQAGVVATHSPSLLDANSQASADLTRALAEVKASRTQVEVAEAESRHWRRELSPDDTARAANQAQRFAAMFVLFTWFFPSWWRLRALLRRGYDFSAHDIAPSWLDVLAKLTTLHAAREHARQHEEATLRAQPWANSVGELTQQLHIARSAASATPLARELSAAWQASPEQARSFGAIAEGIGDARQAAGGILDDAENIALTGIEAAVDRAAGAQAGLKDAIGPLRELFAAPREVRATLRRMPLNAAQLDAAIWQRAIDRTLRERPELANFDHRTSVACQTTLSHGHQHLFELNAHVIRQRAMKTFRERLALCARPAADLDPSERALRTAYNNGRRVLEREFEKVMRHRSIRELSDGDTGTVVYDLKPVWLMSPLSISDTIPLDQQRFDVVIFDEASQIPLEESVPAIMRAPQMIVVGDEMQLPPSSFFASRSSAEDDDVDDIAYELDAESFLSHCARVLPSTMLGWHYRSRHESLIRFSNEAFYGGELNSVPDRLLPAERPPIVVKDVAEGDANATHVLERPISYHRLNESPYTKRTNPGEANYIARLLRGLFASGSEQTIGIVAFSEAQQGEIEQAIVRLAAEDSAFARRHEQELEREVDDQFAGIFVKNLENVQGDERDIIILSVCYGPDMAGKMRMNFGPINKGGGEKRLNVVFSRARHRMVVVSSIEHAQITNQYNNGAMCFRRYLQFSAAACIGDDITANTVLDALGARASHRATRDIGRSVVTDQLFEALEERGYVVLRNLGSTRLRADLGVTTDDSDELKVAILVDRLEGLATADVVERHHVRSSVLRAFGWTLVHVGALEWAENPSACVSRIERAVAHPEEFALAPAAALGAPERVVASDPSSRSSVVEEAVAGTGSIASLSGAVLVLSGTLSALSREEASKRATQAGARVARSVTSRTSCLVVGARPGTALEQAKARGIPIIDERAFMNLVGLGENVASHSNPAGDDRLAASTTHPPAVAPPAISASIVDELPGTSTD